VEEPTSGGNKSQEDDDGTSVWVPFRPLDPHVLAKSVWLTLRAIGSVTYLHGEEGEPDADGTGACGVLRPHGELSFGWWFGDHEGDWERRPVRSKGPFSGDGGRSPGPDQRGKGGTDLAANEDARNCASADWSSPNKKAISGESAYVFQQLCDSPPMLASAVNPAEAPDHMLSFPKVTTLEDASRLSRALLRLPLRCDTVRSLGLDLDLTPSVGHGLRAITQPIKEVQ